MNIATVYWLVPAKAERELFREIIRILAKELDAPRFDPHVTIVVPRANGQSPGEVLRYLKTAPLRMSVDRVAFASRFTKTLFVRLHSNRQFEKLAADLGRITHARPNRPIDPHVSLLYQDVPTAIKKELASAIELPLRYVHFDSIKAVRCRLPVKTRADVERWRVMAERRLSG